MKKGVQALVTLVHHVKTMKLNLCFINKKYTLKMTLIVAVRLPLSSINSSREHLSIGPLRVFIQQIIQRMFLLTVGIENLRTDCS